MKLFPNISNRSPRSLRSASTLIEMMVTVVLFALLIMWMVELQVFGMRVYTLAATKVSSTTDARETMNIIRDGVRSSKYVYVGTYDVPSSTFSRIANGSVQRGNALAIGQTNSVSTNFTFYYLDNTQPTNILYSVSNNVTTILAKYVTNYYCFSAEDYNMNVMTSYINNPVIHVMLQFSQWEFPIAYVGTNGGGNAYDYYRLQARVCRRAKQ